MYQNHHPVKRSSCGWLAGGLSAMIIPTVLRVAQTGQSASEVAFPIIKDNLTSEFVRDVGAD